MPNFKFHFARAFKDTRDSNKTTINSGYVNIVSQMNNDMQKIANENLQALANYANNSVADRNAVETLKEQILEMKSAQTAMNKKNPTSQDKSAIRDKIIPEIVFNKEDGIIKEKINT